MGAEEEGVCILGETMSELPSGMAAVDWSYIVSCVLAIVNTGAGRGSDRYGHSRARAGSSKTCLFVSVVLSC